MASAYSFGERRNLVPSAAFQSALPPAVLLPESFRGGCSFGAAPIRATSPAGVHTAPSVYHRVGLYAKSLCFADLELAWNQSARMGQARHRRPLNRGMSENRPGLSLEDFAAPGT